MIKRDIPITFGKGKRKKTYYLSIKQVEEAVKKAQGEQEKKAGK